MDHTDGRKVQKVTRACDACKAKKAKCSGTKPCDICTRKGTKCTYDALYLRGKPPTPPTSVATRVSATELLDVARNEGKGTATASPLDAHNIVRSSASRNSTEPGTADIHGQYIDPASGLSFLNRARRRFSQGEYQYDTDSLKQDWLRQHVFRAGDKPLLGDDDSLALPPHRDAVELIEFYFDMCAATYRILHKPTVEQWLAVAENNRTSGKQVFQGLENAAAAALLGLLAIADFVRLTITGSTHERESMLQSDRLMRQSLRLTECEGGLPALESIQARLVQVFYHSMTCRFNYAWHVFGQCLQMISAFGLQRRSSKHKVAAQSDYQTDQHRKRIFWSAYILDKYLGVVLGRPPHFHDEDVDQDWPDCVNDEDLLPDGPRLDTSEDCQIAAFVFNAKISRVVGRTSRLLYGIQQENESDRLAAISRLGAQIDEWHDSLPPFLSTVRPSSLIKSLRRQSNALRLAHGHALMHLYRPLLLGDGGSRQRRQSTAALVEYGSTRCIKAAWSILETIAAGAKEGGATGPAFWWTHYVTFCALAVVYVWILQRRRNVIKRRADIDDAKLLELAEVCQHRLANATTLNSPSRKYSFILEELRDEARKPGLHSQLAPPQASGPPYTEPPAPAADEPATFNGPVIDQQAALEMKPTIDSMSLIDTPDWLTDWTNTDWLDLDASAFGILSDFNTDLVWPQNPM